MYFFLFFLFRGINWERMINFVGIYNNRYNMKYGFVRVVVVILIVKVVDCKFNV